MSDSSIKPIRLAVLISGGGTTLRNLVRSVKDDGLPATIELVISSNPKSAGLSCAAQDEIPTLTCRRQGRTDDEYCADIFQPCRERNIDLVMMAGFLKHVLIPEDFVGRVMNIHPSLIPSFCGQGYYGHHVHKAVIDYGAKVTGCTVHFVDNQYDHGPIVLQRVVPVEDGDTVEELAARVFQQECAAYPEAIRLFAQRRLQLDGRHVSIRSADKEDVS